MRSQTSLVSFGAADGDRLGDLMCLCPFRVTRECGLQAVSGYDRMRVTAVVKRDPLGHFWPKKRRRVTALSRYTVIRGLTDF